MCAWPPADPSGCESGAYLQEFSRAQLTAVSAVLTGVGGPVLRGTPWLVELAVNRMCGRQERMGGFCGVGSMLSSFFNS